MNAAIATQHNITLAARPGKFYVDLVTAVQKKGAANCRLVGSKKSKRPTDVLVSHYSTSTSNGQDRRVVGAE